MCYEFWHHARRQAREEDFARRMEKMLDDAKPAQAPARASDRKPQRPEAAPEKEFVPV
ncbi:MAG: hypothetical protein LOY58_14985 [Gammaproteobacteria bacterium]|nr:hypothetical protein [Gammaproteobacteria bacterium]